LQIYEYNHRYDKPVANLLDDKTSSQSKDFSTMSNGEKLREYLGPAHADKYGHPPEVPAKQHEKNVQELKNKLDNPPFLFNGPPDTADLPARENKGQHLTLEKEKIAVAQAWMEKAKANPSDPEVLRQGRKLLAKIKGEQSSEPEQKSRETHRRKLDIAGPCLQGGPPPWDPPTFVTGTGAPVEGGGTAVTVNYDLNTINACLDTITNVEFLTTTIYTCPADCTPGTTSPSDRIFAGMPSTIDPHAVSTATGTDIFWCEQTDSNGGKTPTVPDSITTSVTPEGVMNGGVIQGTPQVFNVYP
jgi:hypothetical protein